MIYLDYAAATPLDPRVLEAMQPYLSEHFGNPSSIHQYGQVCRKAIDQARNTCIELLGAFSAHEIIFTGSGTESCNMALFGAAFARQDKGKHIVISTMEHPAVKEPAKILRDHFGFEVTEVMPDEVEAALRPDTILVSTMLVNNEIGSIQPISKIAKICRDRGILSHTDACQAPGYANVNVEHLGVDMLSLNGSKVYGPKGVGLLYLRQGVQILPHIVGGGQEFRMRGGTENPALIVGLAKALELTLQDSKTESERIQKLRDQLLEELLKLPNITLNGPKENRTANNININIPGISGESLVMRLDMEGLAASSGSACASGKTEPSPTLLALGQTPEQALQSLRLTLGRNTTEAEIKEAIKILKTVIQNKN